MTNDNADLLIQAADLLADGLTLVDESLPGGALAPAMRAGAEALRSTAATPSPAADDGLGGHEKARAMVANALGCNVGAIALTWDGGDELDPPVPSKILDVTISRIWRPHRTTWEKLVAAGLPIYEYDTAAESWEAAEDEPPAEAQHREHVRRARAAIEALRAAGAEKLSRLLMDALQSARCDNVLHVLCNVREWASDYAATDTMLPRASDAAGLLWVVLPEMDLARVGRDLEAP